MAVLAPSTVSDFLPITLLYKSSISLLASYRWCLEPGEQVRVSCRQ